MVIADRSEALVQSKVPQATPPGLIALITRLANRFESQVDSAVPRVRDAFGDRTAAVLTLTVPTEDVDCASQFAAELCYDIEAEFGEVYGVLVVPKDTA